MPAQQVVGEQREQPHDASGRTQRSCSSGSTSLNYSAWARTSPRTRRTEPTRILQEQPLNFRVHILLSADHRPTEPSDLEEPLNVRVNRRDAGGPELAHVDQTVRGTVPINPAASQPNRPQQQRLTGGGEQGVRVGGEVEVPCPGVLDVLDRHGQPRRQGDIIAVVGDAKVVLQILQLRWPGHDRSRPFLRG